ncbi:hypothetical protein, partial [Aeromonas hydrophila]|uniref:hypothetical protein n=1 Tax=Aeromonas hydrophila TaxID=644 RepID=UPI00214E8E7E
MQGALPRLEHAYRELIGKSVLAPPKNIYNAIAGLYKVSTGIVTELGFVTGTGSVKHERMRRDRDCLRTE